MSHVSQAHVVGLLVALLEHKATCRAPACSACVRLLRRADRALGVLRIVDPVGADDIRRRVDRAHDIRCSCCGQERAMTAAFCRRCKWGQPLCGACASSGGNETGLPFKEHLLLLHEAICKGIAR